MDTTQRILDDLRRESSETIAALQHTGTEWKRRYEDTLESLRRAEAGIADLESARSALNGELKSTQATLEEKVARRASEAKA